jgi:mono/diheme cytochrome c family protein
MTQIGRAAALLSVALGLGAAAGWTGDGGAKATGGETAAESTAAPRSGAQTFIARACAGCHDGPGTSSSVDAGPSLADVRTSTAGRREGYDVRTYLIESIDEPAAYVVGGFEAMPELGLTDEEIAALVDYLLGELGVDDGQASADPRRVSQMLHPASAAPEMSRAAPIGHAVPMMSGSTFVMGPLTARVIGLSMPPVPPSTSM